MICVARARRTVRTMLTIDDMIERFDGSLAYSTNSKEICQYIADLLKELKERRNAPEIITCGECKHYKIDHPKANGYHCCYRCHNIFPMKETDFCSRAERRTE